MRLLLKFLTVLLFFYGAGVVVARLAFPLPPLEARQESRSIPISEMTTLGRLVAQGQADHPGKTGVLGISDGNGAIASRLLLARQAEASIDAQYYIWRDDISGRLLLKALHEAALRGVRVRLLLDDNGIGDFDGALAALSALDGFEVRLFNPSRVRAPKAAGYLFDFFRMNRRMHNKAFIVDGATAIVGGRNIADEYFQLTEDGFFLDLDVLAAGAVVPETAAVFDAYWNSASAYPVEMIATMTDVALPGWITGEEAIGPETETMLMSARQGTAADRFLSRESQLEWVDAQVIADDPAKGLGLVQDGGLMISQLREAVGEVTSRLDLISAYFIPGNDGAAYFEGLAQKGARLRILTNAYQTTDVKLVHAGYAKYRPGLLMAGIGLLELKPEAGTVTDSALVSTTGSSAASLHAKVLAIDGKRVFVGSFNFDPRSVLLNCEMGFVIESTALAARIAGRMDTFSTGTYAVRLEGGTLAWTETAEDGSVTELAAEPGTTLFDRWAIRALGWLPIEWLL